jgi:hypothetical protein
MVTVTISIPQNMNRKIEDIRIETNVAYSKIIQKFLQLGFAYAALLEETKKEE